MTGYVLMPPELATERAVDRHAAGSIEATPETVEQSVYPPLKIRLGQGDWDAVAEHVWAAWWQAHYWGQPSRSKERGLALMRMVARDDVPEADQLECARRSISR